ncbi:DUF262 domain-containing protein [Leucobacter tardus]|uniref:DUF262 domain-containing protein n=1 Tax=Leucobacter tardus TaxID=501483 RepID=A0A939QE81_9MICO|nr:DUF262 domain-containing protein [Leucobacter tardus]MBO2989260.1 DUF262 domain-containing protein [Leucobacter tardus]
MAVVVSNSRSLQSLYSWYSEGKLAVNRRYQRKLVWTLEEKQRLVESVLNQYPVPAVLLAEREGDNYEIIDGLQRLHTLMSFIEMKFPTSDDEKFDVSRFATAQERADQGFFEKIEGAKLLDRSRLIAYLDYEMPVTTMRGAEESEIEDVFARINTYGHRLSDQERRQAGVEDKFASMVRELSSAVRGDVSTNVLDLSEMPSISIDLPMSKHGYTVKASDVFWVKQGVLRSTDLRKSEDEQCIADIAASVVGGSVLPRSSEALDAIYESGSSENIRVSSALETKGAAVFQQEFLYCLGEIEKICGSAKLRNLLFSKGNTNGFAATFAVLFIALHEALIEEKKKISDYAGAALALKNLNARLDTSRRGGLADERRNHANVIKGLLAPYLVPAESRDIYGEQSPLEIENIIRRSRIELAHYELKQGLLRLDDQRTLDNEVIEQVLKTICGIANNGKGRSGAVVVGVADKARDAQRVEELDRITPMEVGPERMVVGVNREAAALGETVEDYVARWKTAITNADLSSHLKSSVLSSMTYNDFYGFGVLVLPVPGQDKLSFFNDNVYWRKSDETTKASSTMEIAEIAQRF